TIATVSNTGLVTALKDGTVTITATADGKSGTLEVVISENVVAVESVTITGDDAGLTCQTINLSATVLPANATNKTVTWSSSDDALATVSDSGVVTLKAAGTVTITATADGKSDTHEITITDPVVAVESVEVTGDDEGLVGSTINLSATVLPENATNKTVTWSTSDATIATVSASGLVTLLKVGEV